MVQNKDIKKEKHEIMKNGDAHEETLLLNGKMNEKEDKSEDEDDYLNHLLVVPSLDRNVSSRNMNLISESLLGFYTAIESRKEYEKIKQELMGDLVPIKQEITEQPAVELKLTNIQPIHKTKIEEIEEPINLNDNEQQIEVNKQDLEVRKFTIFFPRARFGKWKSQHFCFIGSLNLILCLFQFQKTHHKCMTNLSYVDDARSSSNLASSVKCIMHLIIGRKRSLLKIQIRQKYHQKMGLRRFENVSEAAEKGSCWFVIYAQKRSGLKHSFDRT